jgi:hypothetical protein
VQVHCCELGALVCGLLVVVSYWLISCVSQYLQFSIKFGESFLFCQCGFGFVCYWLVGREEVFGAHCHSPFQTLGE